MILPPVIMLIKLPRVNEVMPQRVETAGDGGDRSEERTREPDGKHRVLLSQ